MNGYKTFQGAAGSRPSHSVVCGQEASLYVLGKPVQVPLYSSRPTIAVGIVNLSTILPADSSAWSSGRRAQIGQVAVLSAPERLGWKARGCHRRAMELSGGGYGTTAREAMWGD